MIRRVTSFVMLLAGCIGLSGCIVARLVGGMAQNVEYSTLIEVHPAYAGLENKTVAVLVNADLAMIYEHPEVALTIATNVSRLIRTNVPGARVLSAGAIADWQFRTTQWSAMPYGEIAEQLNADRLVLIDLYEYRLHPPGNQWLWEGVCTANVAVIERDGFDPDNFVDSFNIESRFPDIKGVGRDGAVEGRIQLGLLKRFVDRTAWLFYTHLEPKYPDKYKPPP